MAAHDVDTLQKAATVELDTACVHHLLKCVEDLQNDMAFVLLRLEHFDKKLQIASLESPSVALTEASQELHSLARRLDFNPLREGLDGRSNDAITKAMDLLPSVAESSQQSGPANDGLAFVVLQPHESPESPKIVGKPDLLTRECCALATAEADDECIQVRRRWVKQDHEVTDINNMAYPFPFDEHEKHCEYCIIEELTPELTQEHTSSEFTEGCITMQSVIMKAPKRFSFTSDAEQNVMETPDRSNSCAALNSVEQFTPTETSIDNASFSQIDTSDAYSSPQRGSSGTRSASLTRSSLGSEQRASFNE